MTIKMQAENMGMKLTHKNGWYSLSENGTEIAACASENRMQEIIREIDNPHRDCAWGD